MICLISGFPDLWDSKFNGGGSQHLGAGSPFGGSGSQIRGGGSLIKGAGAEIWWGKVPERRSGRIRPNLTLTESEAPQSLNGQHGKGVDGQFEKVSFQTAFEGVESG